MDDGLALEVLLEISQKLNPQNQSHTESKKFPLLDKATVASAMGSVVYILENRHKWRIPCTNLVKRWCDMRDIGLSCRHSSWMENGSSLASIDCLLAVCSTLVDPKCTSNLLSLELQQQEATCLAITCLAEKSEKARKLSTKLFELIIDYPESTENHLHFLAEIWRLRGLLELSLKQIKLLVLKCPYGLEQELVNVASRFISNSSSQTDIYGLEADKTSLVNLCISSPIIFQVTTSILMLLVEKSDAHQCVVNMLIDFVQMCTSDECNVVKLFPAKCQVALALLSISPEDCFSEETDRDAHVGHILNTLADLPLSTCILLVILHPRWMPFVADKL